MVALRAKRKVIREYDVEIPMRDGVILRANIVRPDEEGAFPVLLTRLPYGKDAATSSGASDVMIDLDQMALAGYVVVIQDVRGRNASDGDWDVVPALRRESSDGVDTLHWCAEQDFCDGNIGMFGGSYFAFTQCTLMDCKNPALKAIVPTTVFESVREGFWYRSGALELGLFSVWALGIQFDTLGRLDLSEEELGLAMGNLMAGMIDLPAEMKKLPLGDYPFFRDTRMPPSFQEILSCGYTNPELDRGISLTGHQSDTDIPALYIGGWYDVFLKGTLENFCKTRAFGQGMAKEHTRLIVGPWSHWGRNENLADQYFGPMSSGAAVDLPGTHRRWYDWLLKGQDTGMAQEAPVKLFIMGENHWRDEQEWPLARTCYTPLYLSGGEANSFRGKGCLRFDTEASEGEDSFYYNPADPVPLLGGNELVVPYFQEGPKDQRPVEEREDVLVYTSEPLAEALEVTGPIQAKLWIRSSAKDTDFVVRLTDVYPDGRSVNLADGILRCRYRAYEQTGMVELMEPGKVYQIEVDLWATANVYRPGHRIRVDITSSSFPRWDRNTNSGNDPAVDTEEDFVIAHNTVLHDREHPSHILLPIIPE